MGKKRKHDPQFSPVEYDPVTRNIAVQGSELVAVAAGSKWRVVDLR
jgi:hypothetical protein